MKTIVLILSLAFVCVAQAQAPIIYGPPDTLAPVGSPAHSSRYEQPREIMVHFIDMQKVDKDVREYVLTYVNGLNLRWRSPSLHGQAHIFPQLGSREFLAEVEVVGHLSWPIDGFVGLLGPQQPTNYVDQNRHNRKDGEVTPSQKFGERLLRQGSVVEYDRPIKVAFTTVTMTHGNKERNGFLLIFERRQDVTYESNPVSVFLSAPNADGYREQVRYVAQYLVPDPNAVRNHAFIFVSSVK